MRDASRREVTVTLGGFTRVFAASAVGAFLDEILGPPVRWGLLALALICGAGALWVKSRQRGGDGPNAD